MATYEPHDRYFHKARERGLPSRAAFKIEELIARKNIARRGSRIVDLGCAPGGWLAILASVVGPSGRVAGVDLQRCANLPAGVVTIVGDIREPAVAEQAAAAVGGRADLVTSDLSPKLSGIAPRDEARSRELLEAALEFARAVLRPGGAMIVKVFMGERFKESVESLASNFDSVEVTRTAATRRGSSELYLVMRGFKPKEARGCPS